MNKLLALQTQAIIAAKQQQWDVAISINQQIIDEHADVGAYNRIGIAYLQTNNKTMARDAFESALKIDKSNQIAKKHLKKLIHNLPIQAPSFNQQFIEEPGTTKTVSLHRLAGKKVLESVSVGQVCSLKQKSRFVSIMAEDQYLGALPEDLSLRLCRLMDSGNTYTAWVRSISENECSVFIKETFRSAENKHSHSFATSISTDMSLLTDINESMLLDDHLPAMETMEDEIDVEPAEDDNDEDENRFVATDDEDDDEIPTAKP